jgi:hypothetical protein
METGTKINKRSNQGKTKKTKDKIGDKEAGGSVSMYHYVRTRVSARQQPRA